MKWRCTHCGKPHERNDPPCDNCGHSEFEKAVVPMAPEGDEDAATTHAWICTECGNDHPKHTPPCDRCGHSNLERREIKFDEEEVVAEMLGEGQDRSTPSADVSYLDVLDAKLVAMFLGVGALIVVLALGFTGVIHVPGISPVGPPPGEAETASGLSLADVEDAYVAELNDRRAAEDAGALTVDENLQSGATYANQELVRADYADGDGPDPQEVRSRVGDTCEDIQPASFAVESNLGQEGDTTFETEGELAAALVEEYRSVSGGPEEPENGLIGVDVHVAPDGTVYVTQLVC